jgi:hypothetical protein
VPVITRVHATLQNPNPSSACSSSIESRLLPSLSPSFHIRAPSTLPPYHLRTIAHLSTTSSSCLLPSTTPSFLPSTFAHYPPSVLRQMTTSAALRYTLLV